MHGTGRERIIRVLLSQPNGELTKYRVSKLSECSIGWTMEFLKNLERKKLIKKTRVLNVKKTFDYWVSIAYASKHFDFFISDPETFLKGVNLEYVLTTYTAENRLHHYLFPSRTDIYIRPKDFEKWKTAIVRNRGLVGKGNLRVLVNDEHVFYRKSNVQGLWVASIPQVLLDLRREGGVAFEAYEMMVKRYVH
jgi:hypothetical protein